MLAFSERGKPEYPEKNPQDWRREPTNSSHSWQESNQWDSFTVEGKCCQLSTRPATWYNLQFVVEENWYHALCHFQLTDEYQFRDTFRKLFQSSNHLCNGLFNSHCDIKLFSNYFYNSYILALESTCIYSLCREFQWALNIFSRLLPWNRNYILPSKKMRWLYVKHLF